MHPTNKAARVAGAVYRLAFSGERMRVRCNAGVGVTIGPAVS